MRSKWLFGAWGILVAGWKACLLFLQRLAMEALALSVLWFANQKRSRERQNVRQTFLSAASASPPEVPMVILVADAGPVLTL